MRSFLTMLVMLPIVFIVGRMAGVAGFIGGFCLGRIARDSGAEQAFLIANAILDGVAISNLANWRDRKLFNTLVWSLNKLRKVHGETLAREFIAMGVYGIKPRTADDSMFA